MKIRPGMRISPEKRKNQFRLPMTSNTTAGLPASWPTAGQSSSLELLVGDPEQPGAMGCRLVNHEPEQRPRDHDCRKHRRQHADDEYEGEALDSGRSKEVQDEGGDEARYVRVDDRIQSPVETCLDRGYERLSSPELFFRPLEDQDVGVDRHSYREHEAATPARVSVTGTMRKMA